jgi:cell wall-associated NlpC family hydrolase
VTARDLLVAGVPVTTVWTAPDAPRDVDAAAIAPEPDLTAWPGAMDPATRRGLAGRTLTQLLLGEPVEVVDRDGDWVRVTAPLQPSSVDPAGYPGWVPRRHLAAPVAATGLRAVVTVARTSCTVLDRPPLPLSFGTSLEVEAAADDEVRVVFPGGSRGRLPRAHVRLVPEAPGASGARPTAGDLLGSAALFLGLRYLWGGTSGWGLDCSGLVHLVHRAWGVRVPRDAFDQAAAAAPVDLDAVEPGDLYFFARPGERVYHVGFVSAPVGADGVRRMLHAPEGGELVEDAPLAPHRVETLVAAGRLPRRR